MQTKTHERAWTCLQRGWRRLLPGACLCLAILLCQGCPNGRGTEFGQNFLDVASDSSSGVEDYRYVADSSRHLYWPNTPKYRRKIKKENRVYILDYDTLKQFHGYEAGPK
jgi:hypothetical protein